ncbi:MAG TPA: hypothetical protein VND65_19010, partial [Candidatus Binatia bacterium]|nr:hypothetical protein [Candidatus Binatia bacterium]
STRVFASQGVFSPGASPGLVIIDGQNDTLPRAAEIPVGLSPGLMAITSDRKTVLVVDAVGNAVTIVNTKTESTVGSIPMPGPAQVSPITSMVALASGAGFIAVPAAPITNASPGAVIMINLQTGGVIYTISVPGAQTVAANSTETSVLAFNPATGTITIINPSLVNTGIPFTTTVTGFDSPVGAVFSSDGNTAYVLNCGPECGGTQASVQPLNIATTPPTPGTPIPVNGATVALLQGSSLYVAGNGATAAGPLCTSIPSAPATAAQHCGYLDIVNLTTMQDPYYNNPAAEIAVTDGYHNRIDMSVNGQLFVGAKQCTNEGDVNNPSGEVRGCLAIYNTTTPSVVFPPDNGDVTGLQNFSTRDVEYVVEGTRLRVYDTQTDSLLLTDFVTTGTIIFPGQVVDVKAVDFF